MGVTRIEIEQNVRTEISHWGFKVGLMGQTIDAFGWVSIIGYFLLSLASNKGKPINVSDVGLS